MPGSLLNNTLSSLSSGVSQQYQEGRFDSQVSEMINCMPSLTRGVLRRNPLLAVDNLITVDPTLPADLSNSFVYTYDRGTDTEQYMVIIPGDGSIHVFNTNTGVLEYTKTGEAYLTTIGRAKDIFKALTIGDHTFIVNGTTITKFTADTQPTIGYSDMALYWIKKTASVVEKQYQSSTEVGTLTRGYDYYLNNLEVRSLTDTRPGQPEIHMDTTKLIAEAFAADVANSLVDASDGSIAYNANFVGTDWIWGDTFGDEASLGIWKTLDDSTKLPANLPLALDGFVVKISGGTSSEYEDFFLKYDYPAKTWNEVPAPGSSTTLDPTTMPHALYRLSGGFEFNTFQTILDDGSGLTGTSAWGQRETGGTTSLDDPSFVGNSLTNIFFYRNRLGFITDSTIVLSITGDYGKFFPQTLQNILDDDPIDLAVASTNVTILRHAVPTAASLILFADDTQFVLSASDGPLTPQSADIRALSNYTYGSNADAVSIGNRVFFSNQAGGYSQLYTYKISDRGNQSTEANPLTLHLPTYIDKSVSKIIGHDVLGYNFIEQEADPKELIVLTTTVVGSESLQSAFHKWVFDLDIVSTNIINNDLYILFSTGELCHIVLDLPGSIDSVIYSDEYNLSVLTDYESSLLFSEFFLRDGNGKGTVRGRYQLRTLQYTIEDYSRYITTIYDTNQQLLTDNSFGTPWLDSNFWDDTLIWTDVDPFYSRIYKDDDKVTVMADASKVLITFSSNPEAPTKGFELATVNIEAFFQQRSRRT